LWRRHAAINLARTVDLYESIITKGEKIKEDEITRRRKSSPRWR